MALPANIRVQVGVPFPAQVVGAGGIKVSKTNGIYTIQPDFGSLVLLTPTTNLDPSTKQVWVFDPITGLYNTMTLAGLGDALYRLTSVTSLVIGAGSFIFVTQPNKDIGVGSWVIATSNANPANYMVGQVTAYDVSGNLTISVAASGAGGTGAHADWTIRASSPPGVGATGAAGPVGLTTPPGRLTLTSGTAVMTADVAAATTVFYTGAQFVPLYNGASLVMTATGGELSQATTDATKSPAACAANSNYDVFLWSDAGTIRATRGPAWTSDTARGTGAGTTELDFTTAPGFPLNKNAITNGPAAARGTYVGTIRTNGTSTVDMKFGSAAVGGGKATLGVYNAYNQTLMNAEVTDSSASWSYAAGTVRAINGSANNRIEFVSGLQTQGFLMTYIGAYTTAAVSGTFGQFGFALNSTTTIDRKHLLTAPTAAGLTASGELTKAYKPILGFNFVSGVEVCDGTNGTSFFGNAPNIQALNGQFMM